MDNSNLIQQARALINHLPYTLNETVFSPVQHPEHIEKMLKQFRLNVPLEDILFYIDSTFWKSAKAGTVFTTTQIITEWGGSRDIYDYNNILLKKKRHNALFTEIELVENGINTGKELALPTLVDMTIEDISSSEQLANCLEQLIPLMTSYTAQHSIDHKALQKELVHVLLEVRDVQKTQIQESSSDNVMDNLKMPLVEEADLPVEKATLLTKEMECETAVLNEPEVIEEVAPQRMLQVNAVDEKQDERRTYEEDIYNVFQIHRSPINISDKLFYYKDYEQNSKIAKKFNNVLASYAKAVEINQEKPILIVDNTAFGSAKDGVLLTDSALYWHNIFGASVRVEYDEIKEIGVKKTDIYINGKEMQVTLLGKSGTVKFAELLERAIME